MACPHHNQTVKVPLSQSRTAILTCIHASRSKHPQVFIRMIQLNVT